MSLILFILAWVSTEVQAEPAKNFAAIPELDVSYFLNPPKLPWGVDPFLKTPGFTENKIAEEAYVLNGVFFNVESPLALVNGKSVKVGDFVGERKVEEIGPNFVILKKLGSQIEINLPAAPSAANKALLLNDDEENDE